jgi:hypothetical protein
MKSGAYLAAIYAAYRVAKWSGTGEANAAADGTHQSLIVFIVVTFALCLLVTMLFEGGK